MMSSSFNDITYHKKFLLKYLVLNTLKWRLFSISWPTTRVLPSLPFFQILSYCFYSAVFFTLFSLFKIPFTYSAFCRGHFSRMSQFSLPTWASPPSESSTLSDLYSSNPSPTNQSDHELTPCCLMSPPLVLGQQ